MVIGGVPKEYRNKRELSDGDRRCSEGVAELREKYPMEIGGQRKEFQCKMNMYLILIRVINN